MVACFGSKADLSPYTAVMPRTRLDEKNLATAWGRARSEAMDLTREDAADDLELNEILWRSVKGADSPMPAPVRAGFVLAEGGDDDEEEEERRRKQRR